jgi:hypothetical protein
MLNLTVMDVSRMTDNPGTDRLTLKRLAQLVEGRKSDFENAALHWYDLCSDFQTNKLSRPRRRFVKNGMRLAADLDHCSIPIS